MLYLLYRKLVASLHSFIRYFLYDIAISDRFGVAPGRCSSAINLIKRGRAISRERSRNVLCVCLVSQIQRRPENSWDCSFSAWNREGLRIFVSGMVLCGTFDGSNSDFVIGNVDRVGLDFEVSIQIYNVDFQ